MMYTSIRYFKLPEHGVWTQPDLGWTYVLAVYWWYMNAIVFSSDHYTWSIHVHGVNLVIQGP